jgi:hypothetical protein
MEECVFRFRLTFYELGNPVPDLHRIGILEFEDELDFSPKLTESSSATLMRKPLLSRRKRCSADVCRAPTFRRRVEVGIEARSFEFRHEITCKRGRAGTHWKQST